MLQVWTFEHMPSRVEKRRLAEEKKAIQRGSETIEVPTNTNLPATSVTADSAENNQQQLLNAADMQVSERPPHPPEHTSKPLVQYESSPSDEGDNNTPLREENRAPLQTDNHSIQNEGRHDAKADEDDEDEEAREDRHYLQGFYPDEPHAPLDDRAETQLAVRIRNCPNPEIIKAVIDSTQRTLLTTVQRMQLERRYNNIHDRAYKYDLLLAVSKGFLNPRLIEDQLYRLANQDRIHDDEAWQRHMEDPTKDIGIDTTDDSALPFALASANEKDVYIGNQQLLDDVATQPQGHEQACARMGIDRPENPRYNSMAVNKVFKFWQVVAFDWIHRTKDIGLNGVLLCDSMGLGKTWEMVGFMLSVSLVNASICHLLTHLVSFSPSSFDRSRRRCL